MIFDDMFEPLAPKQPLQQAMAMIFVTMIVLITYNIIFYIYFMSILDTNYSC